MPRRVIFGTADAPDGESGAGSVPANRIAEALRARSFFWTIEFVVSARHNPARDSVERDVTDRLARDNGELAEMSALLIESVPESSRGASSWPPYLRDGAPVLDD